MLREGCELGRWERQLGGLGCPDKGEPQSLLAIPWSALWTALVSPLSSASSWVEPMGSFGRMSDGRKKEKWRYFPQALWLPPKGSLPAGLWVLQWGLLLIWHGSCWAAHFYGKNSVGFGSSPPSPSLFH